VESDKTLHLKKSGIGRIGNLKESTFINTKKRELIPIYSPLVVKKNWTNWTPKKRDA
jgi:hypothetical protein